MNQRPSDPALSPGELLHRTEERGSSVDSVGNFESQHCAARWEAPLYRPALDEALCKKNPQWLAGLSWPEGKRFAACLTHDVDTGYLDSRIELLRVIGKHMSHEAGTKKLRHLASLAGLRHSPGKRDIFSPWVEAEARHGFRSTFFFFATRIRKLHIRDNVYRWDDRTWYRGEKCRVRDVVRDLDQRGWEIGLHGSFLTPTDYDMMAEQKADVESLMARPLVSARQHNLHFETETTPGILNRAGVRVDSTLGFNRDIGFRAGTSYPFRMWDWRNARPLDLLEIPLVLHDCAILRPDNLDLDPASAFPICQRIIDRVAAVRGVVTLLWHPESYAKPGWFDLYTRLLAYIASQNGWGTSCREIADWWTQQGHLEKFHTLTGSPLG